MRARSGLAAIGFVAGLAACNASGGGGSPGDASDLSKTSPAGFLFYTYSLSSELGRCCQACLSATDIRAGALTSTLSGAIPCHASLTSAEASAFAQLATRPDVLAALANPSACPDAGTSVGDLTVGLDDGTVFHVPWIIGCYSDLRLADLDSAAFQLDAKYCSQITCATADAG